MEKGSVSIQYGRQACPESREKAMSPAASDICAEAALSPRIILATNQRSPEAQGKPQVRVPLVPGLSLTWNGGLLWDTAPEQTDKISSALYSTVVDKTQ